MPVEFAVAKTSELADGEMKEVSVGEGAKILLSRVDGQFYATSRLCTHYKAPLVKGVLASDGRLMCPWHGACFRVNKSADIEDGPALNPLESFDVRVDGDTVMVSAASADAFKSTVRAMSSMCSQHDATNTQTCVIVGGGAGGLVTAESLRQHGWAGAIRILSKENYLPIDRIKLSKAPDTPLAKLALRTASELAEMGIRIDLGTEVTSIDTAGHAVTTAKGERVAYSHLVLATGGTPRTLPIQGGDLGRVFVLRSAHDAHAINEAVEEAEDQNVVVIGSSFIGMEIAACLSAEAHVTVVGMEKVPFERVLGLDVGGALKTLHESKGIKLCLEAGVSHFEPRDDHPEYVGRVVLKDGTKLAADMVVLGVGVAPATGLLKTTSIPLERDGSVRVDEHMKVLGTDNIYAVGDIATFPSAQTGKPLRIEHWDVAQNQGRVAAMNIAGQPTPFKHVPYFWTAAHGKNLRYCGNGMGYDDVVVQGDVASLAFVAFYTQGDQVIAVASVGRDPVVSRCSELMRLGKMPSKSQVAAGVDVLTLSL